MLSTLSQTIERLLLTQIQERYGVQYDRLNFTIPPRIELGELALPIAFDLARKLKRAPKLLAEELAQSAQEIPGVWKVDVAGGGYLNFHLDRGSLARNLAESIANQLFGRTPCEDMIGKIVVLSCQIKGSTTAIAGIVVDEPQVVG